MSASEKGKPKSSKRKRNIKNKIQRDRIEEMGVDYINSLRQKVKDLEHIIEEQRDLIRCLESGERRLRVWSVTLACSDGQEHIEYVALVNRKVYQASDYKKLVQRLRMMGYHVKETFYNEKPPVEGKPFDGECDFFNPNTDIREMRIPDGVPPNLLEELGEEEK